MYSELLLKLNLALFAAATIGYLVRYRFPRNAVFTCSLLVIGVSLWLMASTYELAVQGKALTFTRDYAEFSRSQNTGVFTTSVWLHAVLAAILFGAGLGGVIAAFVKKGLRFPRPNEYDRRETMVSAKGILQLLGLGAIVVIVVFYVKHSS